MSVKRSSRVRNPQGQGVRLRADLIAAADRLLAETGDLHGLSLRAVAREVGIATPSIYLHFPDKAALVRAVLEARFAELAETIRAAVTRETDPGRPASGRLPGLLPLRHRAPERLPRAVRSAVGSGPSPTGTVSGGRHPDRRRRIRRSRPGRLSLHAGRPHRRRRCIPRRDERLDGLARHRLAAERHARLPLAAPRAPGRRRPGRPRWTPSQSAAGRRVTAPGPVYFLWRYRDARGWSARSALFRRARWTSCQSCRD